MYISKLMIKLTFPGLISLLLISSYVSGLKALAANLDERDQAASVRQLQIEPDVGPAQFNRPQTPVETIVTLDRSVALTTTESYTIFVPFIQTPETIVTKFGVDFGFLINRPEIQEQDFPLVKEMGANWVRVGLPWRLIEETPGQYNWEKYDPIFERLAELGLKPLPVIFGAPDWAAEKSCGPISDIAALEAFLEATVDRYGDQVEAWEFINEPDAREPSSSFGFLIGCWGLHPEKYAQQLGVFYRKIKTVDPKALVLFGGLAYDNWAVFERSFFEQTLKHGAGDYFDVLSLHYYPINPVDFPTIVHKTNEVQQTMARNGVSDKRIWITETSMWVNASGSEEAQRDFIVEELSRAFCAGVDNILWFAVSQEGPQPPLHRWLIDINHQPDNGYDTFQHLSTRLDRTVCLGSYANVPPNVEAYEFEADNHKVYVLWSKTTPVKVTIPISAQATLIDRDGAISSTVPVQNGQLEFEVGDKAVFVEIAN